VQNVYENGATALLNGSIRLTTEEGNFPAMQTLQE
jgi:hypothetical protein